MGVGRRAALDSACTKSGDHALPPSSPQSVYNDIAREIRLESALFGPPRGARLPTPTNDYPPVLRLKGYLVYRRAWVMPRVEVMGVLVARFAGPRPKGLDPPSIRL